MDVAMFFFVSGTVPYSEAVPRRQPAADHQRHLAALNAFAVFFQLSTSSSFSRARFPSHHINPASILFTSPADNCSLTQEQYIIM